VSGFNAMREVASSVGLVAECDPDQVAAAARQMSEFAQLGLGVYSDAVVGQGLAIAAALQLRACAGPTIAAHYLRLLASRIERADGKAA